MLFLLTPSGPSFPLSIRSSRGEKKMERNLGRVHRATKKKGGAHQWQQLHLAACHAPRELRDKLPHHRCGHTLGVSCKQQGKPSQCNALCPAGMELLGPSGWNPCRIKACRWLANGSGLRDRVVGEKPGFRPIRRCVAIECDLVHAPLVVEPRFML